MSVILWKIHMYILCSSLWCHSLWKYELLLEIPKPFQDFQEAFPFTAMGASIVSGLCLYDDAQ